MRALRLRYLAAVLLILPHLSCGPGLVVDTSTEVLLDGSVTRRVAVAGFPAPEGSKDGSRVEEFAHPFAPERWGRVEEAGGAQRSELRLEGTFRSAAEVPPALVYDTALGPRPGRDALTLESKDLGVLTLWRYREAAADPLQPHDTEVAIDALLDALWRELERAITTEFGGAVDAARAHALVHEQLRAYLVRDGRTLVRAVMLAEKPETERESAALFAKAGIVVPPAAPSAAAPAAPPASGAAATTSFSDRAMDAAAAAAGVRLAAVLSTPERAVRAGEFSFLPGPAPDGSHRAGLFDLERPGAEALKQAVNAFAEVGMGYFGGDMRRFRFRWRAELPGQLLTTNGASDGRVATWFFRNDDVAADRAVMLATSVVLDTGRLGTLRARKSFDNPALLELVDILEVPDDQGGVRKGLEEAVRARDLDVLRDRKKYGELGTELADLLSGRGAK